jgi:hypothetical protein
MRVGLLRMLRCPFCGDSLSFSLRVPDEGDDVEHGLLTFSRKTQCVGELRRIVEESGVIAVARAGNVRVEWKEGFELLPDGYRDLFERLPFRMVSERALVRACWNRTGPSLAVQAPFGSLAGEKWLSLVATRREELFQDLPPFRAGPRRRPAAPEPAVPPRERGHRRQRGPGARGAVAPEASGARRTGRHFGMKLLSRSIGSGKTIVEFFSLAISVSVWR